MCKHHTCTYLLQLIMISLYYGLLSNTRDKRTYIFELLSTFTNLAVFFMPIDTATRLDLLL